VQNINQKVMTLAGFIRAANKIGTFRLGWNDVAKGQPYRAEYETWEPHMQAQYERGRLAALSSGATRGQGKVTRAMAQATLAALQTGAIPPPAVR
jgi:hypothetical protein